MLLPGRSRPLIQTYGGWRNHNSLDSYYRGTSTWGSTNPLTASLAWKTDAHPSAASAHAFGTKATLHRGRRR